MKAGERARTAVVPPHAGRTAADSGGVPLPPVRRVALVRLSSLGDVVHALPLAHALRVTWPSAELTWIVEAREAQLLTGHPELDRVVTVDTRRWRRQWRRPSGARAVLGEIRRLARTLRAIRSEVVVDAQGTWKSGAVTALTRAPVRLGFAPAHCRERAGAWFTNRHVSPPAGAHVVELNLALLDGLAIDGAPGPARFLLPREPGAEAVMAQYLEGEGLKPGTPLLALVPGSPREAKRWPIAAYRRLGSALAARFGLRVLVLWGPGEEPLARAIAHGVGEAALVPPPTSIPEMVALLRHTTLAVGGDTGPIHVAAALGVPAVGLHGPTLARRNGPYGPHARSLQSPTARLADLPVEAVVAAATALLP